MARRKRSLSVIEDATIVMETELTFAMEYNETVRSSLDTFFTPEANPTLTVAVSSNASCAFADLPEFFPAR